MLDELNQAITAYQQTWQALINKQTNRAFLQAQKPTAVAWKTADASTLIKMADELLDDCDQIHWGWINN